MGTKTTHISSQCFSFFSHVILILFLISATAVVQEVLPDVKYTSIGTQITSPTALSLSGSKNSDDTDLYSPSGSKNPTNPLDKPAANPESLITPNKPVSSKENSSSKEGLPGDPIPETKPSDGVTETTKKTKQGLDSDGIPELYGFPLKGKTIFLLDVSGSMDSQYKNTTRLEAMKIELINYIKLMCESDEFDVVIFASDIDDTENCYKPLWGLLSKATPENKLEAIKWIKQIHSYGTTPTYEALKYVCTHYDKDLANLLLITDGYPNDGEEVIKDMPGWFKKFDDCALICISIGGEGYSFIVRLANSVNGTYSMVK